MCIDEPRMEIVFELRAVVGERIRIVERDKRATPRDWIRRADERSGMVAVVVLMVLWCDESRLECWS